MRRGKIGRPQPGVRGWLIAVFAVFFFCSCSGDAEKSGKGPGAGGGGPGAAPVLTAKAVAKTVPSRLSAIGRVESAATVEIRAQVSGPLAEVKIQEGQKVEKGDLLFVLDSRPFENLVWQYETIHGRDLVQVELAKSQKARTTELFQAGLVSRDVHERVEAAAEAQTAAMTANLATLENARLQLSYCKIFAPIAGKAGELLVDPGNLVQANSQTLVTINQLRPIFVAFSTPEQDLARIQSRQAQAPLPVDARIPGDPQPAQGQLSFIDNAVDPTIGAIRLKATFGNDDERLWPGQFVDVVVTLDQIENAVVVPSKAIQTGQTGRFVYVVKPDQTVEVAPVKVGISLGDETVIEEGLTPGLEVVTDGQLRLVPGAKVEIKSGLTETGPDRP